MGCPMFKRVKKGLVESFIGAIGLGWLLADIILHFVNIVAAPVTSWIARSEYPVSNLAHVDVTRVLLLRDALPELIRAVLQGVIWYGLFYWLYIRCEKDPVQETKSIPPNPV